MNDELHLKNLLGNEVFRGKIEELRKEEENLKLSSTAGKALGIKEVGAFLDEGANLEDIARELKKNTRRYAKRQLTWFRADKRVEWVDADRDADEIVGDILGRL